MRLFSNKWLIRAHDERAERELVASLGLRPLTARLLTARGLTEPAAVSSFIKKTDLRFYDPFLLTDMDKAVSRIEQAIRTGERICIYGDYDVDGVTSTTVLYTYLTSRGARCTYFIPDRLSEGYGLSRAAIERLAPDVDLIITVDTGITAAEETAFAASLGVDMIITDHHSCRPVLPQAAAVINPHRPDSAYPFRQLAGVGVVFKLLCALEGDTEAVCRRFADLVAIGTIADVMPLTDENRLIASVGLERLRRTENVGLRALMTHAGVIRPGGVQKRITSSTVGYVLAPRMTAAGRIASASRAVELLLCRDDRQADAIAAELCEVNKIRQQTEQTIYEQAEEQIRLYGKDASAYVLADDGWHQGVIGVVASKITEKYSLPSILFSFDGDVAKGSGRSIKGLSLMDALAHCSDLLIEYGGHELAAGLSVERGKLDAFRRRFCEYVGERLRTVERTLPLEADCCAHFDELDLRTAEELRLLEPFGLQNPVPTFLLEEVTLAEMIPLSDGRHIRLLVTDGRRTANAVYFGMSPSEFPVFAGEKCDLLFTLDVNEYNGSASAQLILKAARPSKAVRDAIERELHLYELVRKGTPEEPDAITPALGDFRAVFRFLKHELNGGKRRLSLRYMQKRLRAVEGRSIGLCKLRIVLDVLEESGLADCSYVKGFDLAELMILPFSGKINLDDSQILKRLKEHA